MRVESGTWSLNESMHMSVCKCMSVYKHLCVLRGVSAEVRADLQASCQWQWYTQPCPPERQLVHAEVASLVQHWAKLPAAAEVTGDLKC